MKRPPKPRIVKPHLAWKWSKARGTWEPYHRVTWQENGRRRERAIKLDWRGDSEVLDRLYWECANGKHDRQKPAPPQHSWRALVIAWRQDPRVQKRLSGGTKRKYRSIMDRIVEKNGAKDVRKTTRQDLRKAHDSMADRPRMADWYLQVVSLLWNYGAEQLDWPLGPNPAKGIEKFGAQREFEPWPDWMVAKLKDAPENVRAAAELILGTGQRPNAAITMRFDQFLGEWMQVLDEKNDETIEVYCPEPLRAFIAGAPRRGAHVLARNLTQPLGYSAVEKAFSAWRKDLGPKARPYVLHGLRKLAIVRLAEAGCSDAEIQAVTNQSAEMVAFYRRKASRRALSRAAQERLK